MRRRSMGLPRAFAYLYIHGRSRPGWQYRPHFGGINRRGIRDLHRALLRIPKQETGINQELTLIWLMC